MNKLIWITTAQVIGCLLVIWGHSYPFKIYIPEGLSFLKAFLYSFHMAFFVLISGFLCGYSKGYNKYGTGIYIKNRAVKLLVPYFALSLIALLPKIMVASYINDAMPEEVSAWFFIRTLFIPREGVWGHFWFLPMLFFVQIIALFFIKLYDWNKKGYFVLLAFMLGLTYISPYVTGWFSLSDICNFLFWYMIGFTASQINLEKAKLPLVYCIWGLALALILYVYKMGGIEKPLIVICMAVFIISCSLNLHFEKKQLFKSLTGKTYAVYILSWPVQTVVEIVTNKLLHWNVYVCMLSMFLLGIIVPLLIIRLVKLVEKFLNTNKLSLIIGA